MPADVENLRRHRQRYRELGLVQINVWVPKRMKNELLRQADIMRQEHISMAEKLEKVGGEIERL